MKGSYVQSFMQLEDLPNSECKFWNEINKAVDIHVTSESIYLGCVKWSKQKDFKNFILERAMRNAVLLK